MKRDEIFERAKLPSLAKEGWLRHQENGPLPLKARPGWFVQQPIIGGLNQPPRLRPLRRLRSILLTGAAFLDASPYRARASRPPWPRRGVRAALCFFLLLCGCRQAIPEQATWNGTVELAEGKITLPFQMELDLRSTKPTGDFLIGTEKAPIPEITRQGNSLTFGFSEYGAEMRGAWDGSQLKGTYVRHRADKTTTLKFSASPKMLPANPGGSASTPAGKYQVYFENQNRNESATVASFWMQSDDIYGTLIAPDGDYGLLVGRADGGNQKSGCEVHV